MIGKLAQGIKDGGLSLALKRFLNDRFSKYGEVLECQVDTEHNQLHLRALLKGESQAIDAVLERYEIIREGDDRFIRLIGFSCSREWIDALLNQSFADKQYKLPNAISALL